MFVVLESIGTIRGVHYVSADGTRIPSVVQQLIWFMVIDGTWTEIMFQLAVINKSLVSVSKLNESGYRVIFDDEVLHHPQEDLEGYPHAEGGGASS